MTVMTSDPVYRLATPKDTALVRSINAAAYIPAYEAVIGAIPKPAFEDCAHSIEKESVWIAEIDGQASGVLIIVHAPDHMMVYSIAVLPWRQRAGLGKALLSFAEKLALEMGLPELRLYTNRRMERNVALYTSCGFVEIATRPHPSRPGEVLVDMVKPLGV